MQQKFRDILKKLRQDKGLYQKDLAEDLKVERTTVVHWEAGRVEPNLEMLDKIADYFNVTADYLLGRERQNNIPSTAHSSDPVTIEISREKASEFKRLLDEAEKNSKKNKGD